MATPTSRPPKLRPGETAAHRVALVYWGIIALVFVGYHLYGAGYAVWLLATWLLAVRT
jgi:hypothetical protein